MSSCRKFDSIAVMDLRWRQIDWWRLRRAADSRRREAAVAKAQMASSSAFEDELDGPFWSGCFCY